MLCCLLVLHDVHAIVMSFENFKLTALTPLSGRSA